MDARESFKFQFMMKCAEAGLSPAETCRAARIAANIAEKRAWGEFMNNPITSLGIAGLGLAGAGGAAIGHTLAKSTEPEFDPEVLKQQEVIQALQQETARAKQNTAMLKRRAQPVKPQYNRAY